MLSLNSLRSICTSRGLPSNWLMTNRQCLSKAVTYATKCNSTPFSKEDMRHSKVNFRRGREVIYKTGVNSLRNYCTAQVKLNCWNCQQALDKAPAFFCMSCKVVQPPDEGVSHFQIMDCDRSFTLDPQKLQRRYLQLQRLLHPDNFSQKTVKEQEYSENQSALVNKAYETLLKPLSRGLYMLELEGMHIEEDAGSGADAEFLMELMEINEALDEAQTPEEANKIGQNTKVKLTDLTEQIDAALRKGELQAAKALLAQMKYFANIQEKVKEKLSQLM
ncbi:iron-sulfur cluster co-chaperone protein HscB isoform X1 [Centroberyx gerrardi]|uniref:iron-sulfur cluster co-chaperone protein HscB isoform X1 n=1 Tax=Centroberyx gerrardi TaxID=166262 RepID=UPI003AAC4080